MSVLVEGVSVVIQLEAIELRYEGGRPKFIFDLPVLGSHWADGKVVTVKFSNHDDAREYLKSLAMRGLKVASLTVDDDYWSDAVLVDQTFGPSHRTYWFKFARKLFDEHSLMSYVWHSDAEDEDFSRAKATWAWDNVVFPKDWELEKSETRNLDFQRMSENRSIFDH